MRNPISVSCPGTLTEPFVESEGGRGDRRNGKAVCHFQLSVPLSDLLLTDPITRRGEMENVEVLNLVFERLGAPDLGSACCCCKLWRDVGGSEHLWRTLCRLKWPACEKAYGKDVVLAMGGFKAFFTRRALSSMPKQAPLHPPRPWLRPHHLTFFVDLTHRGRSLISEAVPGSALDRSSGPCFRIRLDSGVATEPVLPRQALTPLFYQGELFYGRPFQAGHASEYWITWSVVRSLDHRVACLLHCAAAADGERPWEQPVSSQPSVPLVFKADLDASAGSCGPGRLGAFVPVTMSNVGCVECRPIWGRSLSQPMRFALLEVQLGVVWKPIALDNFPCLDEILLALQQLDWK